MEFKDTKLIYFIGADGIGMSIIARYFFHKGLGTAGYGKTPSEFTHTLEKEEMDVRYEKNAQLIPAACKEPASTLVIYTPAIPPNHAELVYFRKNGFEIQRHAQVLGTLTQTHKDFCFIGTHEKTVTSNMCIHFMYQSHLDCNAFLGSISRNCGTNHIFSDHSDFVMIEADEFDHSFH